MRLFVAIQLSDEMKKSLTGLMHDCKTQGIKEIIRRRRICILPCASSVRRRKRIRLNRH